jgi:hypothetical protein
MKTITILMITLAVSVNCAYAQDVKAKETKPKSKDINAADVPAAVTKKFNTLYPMAKDVEWEMEDANYEAEFDVNKMETKVFFNAAGDVIKTKTEINSADLPEEARTYLKNHPGKKIKKMLKKTDGQGVVTYIAEVDDDKDLFMIFDASGKFLEEKKK